jgi:DMSO/TMAO reductase YedYZ molybdopterin-dependent catalytic subunit
MWPAAPPRSACCAGSRNSTTGCRPGCSTRTSSRRPTRRARSGGRFPFNAYYDEDEAPEVDGATFKLEVGGLIDNKQPWTLEQLYALPEESQITRHICVEGWSAIGSWQGVRLSEFLRRLGADTRAKYVWFQCAEGYSTTIDMPTALHPQTQLTFKFDKEILPRKYGFPMKCRMPTKLGFKNPKHVIAMHVTNKDLGGYWEDRGYNWFSGL